MRNGCMLNCTDLYSNRCRFIQTNRQAELFKDCENKVETLFSSEELLNKLTKFVFACFKMIAASS